MIDTAGGLDARSLGKRFGDVVAVADVSLMVRPGEIVGLLGPNGAGKTTTLRMLAGILSPDRGRVLVDGVDVHADPIVAKRRIGFLSGDTQLYQRLSPREVLAYFGQLYELDPAVVAARSRTLIAELDMGAYADRACGTLSSGQKQRANVARAFLHDPPLLILDEPTNALDVVSGQFIVQAIRQARDAGRAVLFSTHIMGEAEYLCDRIVLIHQGRVVDAGPLADLLVRSGQRNLTDAFLHYAGATVPVPAA
jgi:sodium transport system ATP-binding protein